MGLISRQPNELGAKGKEIERAEPTEDYAKSLYGPDVSHVRMIQGLMANKGGRPTGRHDDTRPPSQEFHLRGDMAKIAGLRFGHNSDTVWTWRSPKYGEHYRKPTPSLD